MQRVLLLPLLGTAGVLLPTAPCPGAHPENSVVEEHSDMPVDGAIVPAAHGVHAADPLLPVVDCPLGHALQLFDAPFPAYWPVGHLAHWLWAAGEYRPTAHASHWNAPGKLAKCPGAHASHAWAPVAVE